MRLPLTGSRGEIAAAPVHSSQSGNSQPLLVEAGHQLGDRRPAQSTYLATRNTAPRLPDTIFLRSTSTTTNYRSEVAIEAGAGELKRRIAFLLDHLTTDSVVPNGGLSRAAYTRRMCSTPTGRMKRW